VSYIPRSRQGPKRGFVELQSPTMERQLPFPRRHDCEMGYSLSAPNIWLIDLL
jgi:hypothetical protein